MFKTWICTLFTDMVSSPVCDLAPELQTFEIPEGFMKHPVYVLYFNYNL
jgi:hypothetical protein